MGLPYNPEEVNWGDVVLITYEMEVIIPLEVSLPTLRTAQLEAWGNDAALEEALDFAEEKREIALIRLANYQQALLKRRQGQVKTREFQVGDLVLRKSLGTAVKAKEWKLRQNWRGCIECLRHCQLGHAIWKIWTTVLSQIRGTFPTLEDIISS